MAYAALVRATLALLLLTAAVAKAPRLGAFAAALRGYGILPAVLVRPVAAATVGAEVVLGLLLVTGVGGRIGLVGAGLLLLAFAAVVTVAVRRRGATQCGCLGTLLEIRLGWPAAYVNAVLAVAAFAAATHDPVALPLPRGAASASDLTFVAWAAGGALVLLYWVGLYASTVLASVEHSLREVE